jgi:hypothetical protein
MAKPATTWLGEVGEQRWRLCLPPRAVLRRIEENTDRPFTEGGPLIGRVVSRFEGHVFRLRVPAVFGGRGSPLGIPRLIGQVESDDDGSLLTFHVELPMAPLVWLPGLVLAGVVFAIYLVGVVVVSAQEGADAVQVAVSGLCCMAVLLAPLALIEGFVILRARSMSARLIALMVELFDDARVLELEVPLPGQDRAATDNTDT